MNDKQLNDALGSLAARARDEVAPRVRVEARVLETLSALSEDRAPALGWFALASCAAAAAALYVAAPMLLELTDPMSSMFRAAAL